MPSILLPLHFQKLKQNLELKESFQTIIEQRHNAVRSYIENNAQRSIETKLIGSLQRRTRIQPLPDTTFDIDILVELGTFSTRGPGGMRPQNVQNELQSILLPSQRYSAMNPVQDDPTLTFPYGDGRVKVELVPVFRDAIGWSLDYTQSYSPGRCYWVPKYGHWEIADYDYEAAYLSQLNAKVSGKLIPFIKVLKALKRNLLNFDGLSSIHLEILAAKFLPKIVFRRNLEGMPTNTPLLLLEFLTMAQRFILGPLNFSGSHFPNRYIEEPARSLLLLNIPAVLVKINFLLSPGLTETNRIDGWREIFGNVFPVEVS